MQLLVTVTRMVYAYRRTRRNFPTPLETTMPAAHRVPPAVVAFALLALTALIPFHAHALTPTTTTLTLSAPCFTQGCILTFTAKVTGGSSSVHPGLVYFCEGSVANCENTIAIGHAQLTATGSAAIVVGAQSLVPGTHQIYAVFAGTSVYSGSSSAVQELTVPSSVLTTLTNLSATPADQAGQYKLQAQVTSLGNSGATGNVSFFDTSFANAPLGSVPMTNNGFVGFYDNANLFDLTGIPSNYFGDVVKVATGDFNRDGSDDILLVGAHAIHVMLGSANRRFTLAPSSSPNLGTSSGDIKVADFNSDGKLDIAVPDASTHSVRVSLGNGDGTFTDVTPTTFTENPVNVYVGDFNGDGIPDLVVTIQDPSTQTYALQVALGNGNGTFTPQSATYLSGHITNLPVYIADEDGDGKLDLIVTDSGTFASQLRVLHGNGDGTFTAVAAATQTTAPILTTAGDYTGDGILDVFIYDGNNIVMWAGVGDGTFVQPPNGYGVLNIEDRIFKSLVTGDFDHNGTLEPAGAVLETLNPTPDSAYIVYVGQNTPPGYLSYAPLDGLPIPDLNGSVYTPGSIAVGDFNGDGFLDILDFTPTTTPETTNYAGGNIFVLDSATSPAITLGATGIHQVVATYQGDSSHLASTSPPQALTGAQSANGGTSFTGLTSVSLNGGASLDGGVLRLTDGNSFEARSAFYPTRVPVYDFQTSFEFQIPNQESDGLAFVLQSNGPNAIGSNGGGIGYGVAPGASSGASIINSLAVIFDTHNNQGEGANSVRIETGGITSPAGSVDLTSSGIDLHSGDHFLAQIVHAETTGALGLTINDLDTGKSFTHTFTVDLFGALGDTSGYAGFTSATGATASTVSVLKWTYSGERCCDTIGSTNTPYYPNGFVNPGSAIQFYGGSALSGTALQLTSGGTFEATRTNILGAVESQQWVTDFDFAIQGTGGDGFTFFRSSDGYPGVTGGFGGALGYAGPYRGGNPGAPAGLGDSLAIKFDLHDNAGESPNSTGLYFNGASPTTPALDLYPSRVDLHSGHTFHARISYFRGAISLSITDLTSYAVFTTRFAPSTGLGTASVGFTAATGATANTIQILNWTYDSVDVDF